MQRPHSPHVNRRASQRAKHSTHRTVTPSSDRSASRSHRRPPFKPLELWRRLAISAIFLLCLIATGWILLSALRPPAPIITEQADERYYFADSKYSGIRSKFVTRRSEKEQVSIEYPITGIAPIDTFVQQAIDRHDGEFRQMQSSAVNSPMTETISYQVTHQSDTHLSLVLHIKQDTHGAHPASLTQFWTFDKQAGRSITLRELLMQQEGALKAIVAAARQHVAAALEQQHKPAASLDELLTESHLEHFVVMDRSHIGWPFGQHAFLPSSYGEVPISLPIAPLAEHLQHPLAQALFEVPVPPKPEVTAPAPPAPSASCGATPCIALTFDDGPGPHTERLLNILQEREAKATFYVLGNKAAAHAATLRRIKQQGHEIGNHSWGHANLAKLSAEEVRNDLSRTNDAIRDAVGTAPTSARPPYGSTNDTVRTELSRLGMSSVLWSVDTRDWADRDSGIVCSRALASAKSGAIVLLHDIHSTSVDAVPCILDGLKKQGYRFITASELLGAMTPGQNYYSGS